MRREQKAADAEVAFAQAKINAVVAAAEFRLKAQALPTDAFQAPQQTELAQGFASKAPEDICFPPTSVADLPRAHFDEFRQAPTWLFSKQRGKT